MLWKAAALFACLGLALAASNDAAVFDVFLVYPQFNVQNYESSGLKAEQFFDLKRQGLQDEISQIFGDKDLSVDVYEIVEGGDSNTLPIRAYIRTHAVASRDEFIAKWQASRTEIMAFSIGLTAKVPDTRSVKPLNFFFKNGSENAVVSCANGGYLLPNATCVCPAFTTQADCSRIRCEASGIPNGQNRCSCPPGRLGRHCEQIGCVGTFDTDLSSGARTFVLIVNLRASLAYSISRFQLGLPATLATTNYTNYILGYYYYGGIGVNFNYSSLYYNQSDFLDALNQIFPSQPTTYRQYTTAAIYHTLRTYGDIAPRADVYVLVDAFEYDNPVPASNVYNDNARESENHLLRTTLDWGHAIYILVPYASQISDPFTSAYADAYRRIAANSFGAYVYVGTESAFGAFQSIYNLNNETNTQTLAAQSHYFCRSIQPSVTVTLGPYDSQLVVFTEGANSTLTVNGTSLTPTITYPNFNAFSIAASAGQIFALQVSAPGTTLVDYCSFRAFTYSTVNTLSALTTNAGAIEVSSSYSIFNNVYSPVVGLQPASGVTGTTLQIISAANVSAIRYATASGVANSSRANCIFPVQFPVFSCNVAEAYFIQTQRTDAAGTTTRVSPGACLYPVVNSSAPPTPACQGTSTYLGCACNQYQTGNYCEIPLCQNGGTVQPFPGPGIQPCLCNSGFSGDYCQNVSCTATTPRPRTSYSTLSLVYQVTTSTSSAVPSLYTAARALSVNQQVAGIFQSVILTRFANTTNGAFVQSVQYSGASAWSAIANGTALPTSGGGVSADYQPQNSIAALNDTLNQVVAYPWQHTIFLVTDSVPGDSVYNTSIVLTRALDRAAVIHVILVRPYGAYAPVSLCPNDTSSLQHIADVTGGIFVNLCSASGDNTAITSAVQNIGNSAVRYAANQRATFDCTSTSIQVPQADGNPSRYFIVSTGSNATYAATLTQNGTNVALTSSQAVGLATFNTTSLTTAGNYTLTLSTTSTTVGSSCSVTVLTPTLLDIFIGFVSNPDVDYVDLPPKFAQSSYPVLFFSALPIQTPNISLTIGNTVVSNATLRDPNTCNFDYLFDYQVGCTSVQAPVSIDAQISIANSTFSRSFRTTCTGISPGTCVNGGVYVSSTGLCTCSSEYSGQYCEVPVCQNGGTPSQAQCSCLPGWEGSHCQIARCSPPNYLAPYASTGTVFHSVVFVVSTSLPSFQMTNGLKSDLITYLNNVYNPAVPRQYILVTCNTSTTEVVTITTDINAFNAAFTAINTLADINNGPTYSVDAIARAVSLISYKPAIINVFTASDTVVNNTAFAGLNAAVGRGGIQINVLVRNVAAELPSTGNYDYFQYLASASGGRLILQTGYNSQLITEAFPRFLQENVILADGYQTSCKTQQALYFTVDSYITFFTVYIRGNLNSPTSGSLVTFYDAAGNKVSSSFTALLYGSSVYSFRSVDANITKFVGNWRVVLSTSSDICHVQVTASSVLQTTVGFAANPFDDFPYPLLVNSDSSTRYVAVDTATSLVLGGNISLTGITFSGVNVATAAYTTLATTTLNPRNPDFCAYEFISPPVTIGSYGIAGLGAVQAVITGQDASAIPLQRVLWYLPQPARCLNGGTLNLDGSCVCPTQYIGQECDWPVCQNGGTPGPVVCTCPPDYHGTFCDTHYTAQPAANGTSYDF